MDLHTMTIAELVGHIRRGDVSPVEVATDFIGVIEERDAGLHAYLDLFADDMLASARALEARGDEGLPLFGVPVAIKDNICTRAGTTSCASRILEGYRSPYDATAVRRLREAGAIVAGKTNMDEFGMGSSTENSAFGPTMNPWDRGRVPGGSSGGSAAAVAAGMAAAALGTDTGGSIRQPASFCGVVGVKPTYGRVSRYGLVAFASSFDQIGPIARTVADAATVLDAISGPDPRDATSLDTVDDDVAAGLGRGLDGVTVGIPWELLESDIDAAVDDNFRALVRRLEGAGVAVRDVALPNAEYAVATYYVIANAEASANLARFDGVKYGRRGDAVDNLYDLYARTRGEKFGAEVKRRILLGTYVLSAGYHDAYYTRAQKVRSLAIQDYRAAFAACDVVLTPTAPTPAFELGEKVEDPLAMYLCDVFTIPASLAGLPAVSVPSGLSGEGLPLGVQLVGRAGDEATVLRAAAGIEEVVGFQGVADA